MAIVISFTGQAVPVYAEETGTSTIVVPGGDLGYSLGTPGEDLITPNASDTTFVAGDPANPRSRLINVYEWGQCYVFNNETLVLERHTAPTGTVSPGSYALQCGTPTQHGYRHIENEHQAQWEQKRISFSVGGSWDDLMNGMVKLALNNPQYSKIQAGSKACYQGTYPVQWSPYCPWQSVTVIVSTNNKRIITAFPALHC